MLENEIRHATICEEVNRAYKQGAGKEFHETFHGFRDRNDAIKMSRSLLGLNLDMFKKMSRIRDFKAAQREYACTRRRGIALVVSGKIVDFGDGRVRLQNPHRLAVLDIG